jgi:hypothetical protein
MTIGLAVGPAAVAFAAGTSTCDSYSQKCPVVKGEKFQKPPAVQGDRITQSPLPFTGADIAGYTLAGAAAVGGGALIVVAGRRRRRLAV